MSMNEVRLLELALKGERLDELNAEEVLNRRAKAAERRQAFFLLLKRLGTALGRKSTPPVVESPEVVLSPQR